MNNTIINVKNENFSLVDENGKIILTHNEWEEITNYANKHDLNIIYYPKDLIFSVEENEDNGCYLLLDIKYGCGGHDNLGSHNVKGLPSYVSEHEDMECHFSLKKKVSKKKIITDMVILGAKFEGILEKNSEVYLEQIDKIIQLKDMAGTVIYENKKWEKIEDYASEHKLNIIFKPKDLLYRFSDDNQKLVLNVKYGSCQYSENELKNNNIKSLPNLIWKDSQYGEFMLKEWVNTPELKDSTAAKLEKLGFIKNPKEHSTDDYYNNVKVEVKDNIFSLIDIQGKVVCENANWENIEKFAAKKKYNIVFYPKDLKFNVIEESSFLSNCYVVVDIKYGKGREDLDADKNLRDFPSFLISVKQGLCRTNENKDVIVVKLLEAGMEESENFNKPTYQTRKIGNGKIKIIF